MSILILGSEGFVGSAICDKLLADGYDVVGVDNYLKGYTPTKHFSHPNFKFVRLDLTEVIPSFKDLESADTWIIAAATLGGVGYFHKYPFDMIGYNSLLMSQILRSAVVHKPKKIVYLSSSMVYENVSHFPSRESDVDFSPAPYSAYGFAKLAGERTLAAYAHQHECEYSICRLFNCVGTDEKFDLPFIQGDVHVLPEFVYLALTAKDPHAPVKILGDGNQIRCFTDKRDLASGIVKAMIYGNNETFNISTPVATNIRSLLDKVWLKVHGHKANIETGHKLPHDVQVRIPDCSKATELLGFKPEYSLTDSVDEVIKWMKLSLNESTKQ